MSTITTMASDSEKTMAGSDERMGTAVEDVRWYAYVRGDKNAMTQAVTEPDASGSRRKCISVV